MFLRDPSHSRQPSKWTWRHPVTLQTLEFILRIIPHPNLLRVYFVLVCRYLIIYLENIYPVSTYCSRDSFYIVVYNTSPSLLVIFSIVHLSGNNLVVPLERSNPLRWIIGHCLQKVAPIASVTDLNGKTSCMLLVLIWFSKMSTSFMLIFSCFYWLIVLNYLFNLAELF